MKIVSFNVNGLRAIINKGFDTIFNNFDADIISLNETKFSDDKVEFPYENSAYFLYKAYSKVRKGYSGVAVYSKIKPISVHYGLKDNKYDEEGRVITLEFDNFYYIACYVPNSGEGLKRLGFRMVFEDDMLNYLNELSAKKPIIYGGDLNVAHHEIDIKNPSSNLRNPGFTIEEREKMDRLLNNGYIDTFRYLYPNVIKYSRWSYRFNARANNAGWRIDYFIISSCLKNKLIDSKIDNEIFGSDHCPIELIIDL